MKTFITIAVTFLLFCFIGWCIELIYRSSKTHHLVNPGFMQGCVLPLYGSGGTILYLICSMPLGIESLVWSVIVRCIIGTVLMTVIEYFAGLMSLKFYHTRLWDYSKRWGNIQGIICPMFSFFWGILTVVFYFIFAKTGILVNVGAFVYDHIGFVMLLGVLYGIFFVDLFHSLSLLDKLRSYAKKHAMDIRFEEFKEAVLQKASELSRAKNNFILLCKSNKHVVAFIDKMNSIKELKSQDEEIEKKNEENK